MNSDFIVGSWICSLDGISQILEIKHTYREEYPISYGQSYEIGDVLQTIVIYKIYCSFAGKIRKRDHVKRCAASLCEPLSEEMTCMLNSLRDVNKSFNDKFDKIVKTNCIEHRIRTSIYVNKLIAEDVIDFSNNYVFKNEMFAMDFFEVLCDRFNIFQKQIFVNQDENLKRISFLLFNDNLLFVDKKAVITGVFAEAYS